MCTTNCIKKVDLEILKNMLRVRLAQMIINEQCKKGVFKIPIHLAMGHEAIAVAIDAIMENDDQLVLSHRNMHYNLARAGYLRPEIDEYLLKEEGMANGRLGSMNLMNAVRGIVYTSSILGNNLSVATGIALGMKVKCTEGVCIVITGDGAIEEGSFYESILFQKSNELRTLIIIENNDWSLATRIKERRCDIDIRKLMQSVGISYEEFRSNDAYEYIKRLKEIKKRLLSDKVPACVEVKLSTLGYWHMKTEQYPNGKHINYHAGAAPTVDLSKGPLIAETIEDPLFVMQDYFKKQEVEGIVQEILESFKKEAL